MTNLPATWITALEQPSPDKFKSCPYAQSPLQGETHPSVGLFATYVLL